MIKRILIIIAVILALIALGIMALFYLFAKGLCGDTQIGKYQSSDSRYEVNYYERDCGATTAFVENLELNGQTILRATTYGNNDYPFSVKWVGNQKVSVTTASSTTSVRVYRIHDTYKNIQIIFDDKIKSGTKVNN